MLGLRKLQGIYLEDYSTLFENSINSDFGCKIKKYLENKFLILDKNKLYINPKRINIYNSIVSDILLDFPKHERYDLSSQIRSSNGTLYAEFDISETATLGTYLFTVNASTTSAFPITILYFDIEYNNNGIISSSDTVELSVLKDVTINE
jgi:hypothetical protein